MSSIGCDLQSDLNEGIRMNLELLDPVFSEPGKAEQLGRKRLEPVRVVGPTNFYLVSDFVVDVKVKLNDVIDDGGVVVFSGTGRCLLLHDVRQGKREQLGRREAVERGVLNTKNSSLTWTCIF